MSEISLNPCKASLTKQEFDAFKVIKISQLIVVFLNHYVLVV